ncbi:MAG: VIT domain-containing protein, partial [Gammaproteobacteria bacterium]|nr:VIT domain-containing protein [Gammaproteobacteria bacterium]
MNTQRLIGWHYRVCLTLLCAGMSISGYVAEAGTSRNINMGEIKTGELLFRTTEAGAYDPAIHLETDVDIEVNGMVASVIVKQRFHNPGTDWVHGVYAFPLPEDSAVNGMRIEVGERVIVGEIQEKQAARRNFEAAKQAGKKAALVEQQRPNMFRSSIANIPPGEEVSVTLTYLQKVAFTDGRFSIRFPMTITPRYIPRNPLPHSESSDLVAQHGWAIATDQVPDAAQITPLDNPASARAANPINAARLTARLNPGLPLADVSSAYHQIHVVRDKNRYEISLYAKEMTMDRDFELSWMPTQSTVPQAALFTESRGGEDYAMLMLVPPQQTKQLTAMSREVVFVIDRSGSMSGESIRQARKALLFALDKLTPVDSFNIIQFDDT